MSTSPAVAGHGLEFVLRPLACSRESVNLVLKSIYNNGLLLNKDTVERVDELELCRW